MDAGQLDQRITIQQRTVGQDAAGGATYTWSTLATMWARAQPLRGREFLQAAQTQANVDVKFSIRYRSDVAPTMNVSWRGVDHNIAAVMDVEGAKEWLELMCVMGPRDGL